MKKYMLLTQTNSSDWALNEWAKNGALSFVIFKKMPKCLRALRRLWLNFRLPFSSIWYSREWKVRLQECDIIVVHMSELTLQIPKYINRCNPAAKVIAWYWNTVNQKSDPRRIMGKCELWSFDPMDCKKYGMRFNHQYYFKSLIQESSEKEWDVFFCGNDGGRGEILTKLYNVFVEQKVTVNFKIVNPKYNKIPNELKSNFLSYSIINECNRKSRAILEIMRTGQSGATVRLMEALFNKKKIITNNPFVKKEPFYNENNIFIIGERPLEELKAFIDSDYDNSSDKYIDEYDFNNWLKNFDN